MKITTQQLPILKETHGFEDAYMASLLKITDEEYATMIAEDAPLSEEQNERIIYLFDLSPEAMRAFTQRHAAMKRAGE